MEDGSDPNGVRPADLFELRDKLEAQWSSDYLNGPPPEAQDLCFLLGDWHMTRRAYDLKGAIAHESEGEMRARQLLEGRVIQEEYHSYLPDGRVFRGGVSLYTFIPSTRQWETASVDAAIGANNAIVKKDGGEFHYESSFLVQGTTVRLRGRWLDIAQGAFKWSGSASTDGDFWFKTFETHMVRRGAA